MARCDAVQQWDENAFEKAYKWASYFEEVYQRLQTKPLLAEKLDKYLANFNKSGQIYLGNLKLSLEVLGKSKSLLRQFLLQNPHLSESQYEMTLKLYASKVGEWLDCSTSNDLHKDASHLSQTRAAVQLLSKMRDRLTEDMKSTKDRIVKETSSTSPLSKVEEFPSAVTSEDIVVDVAAQCLFKHVEHQLQYGAPKNKTELCDKLKILAEQENGLNSIISSLLLSPDDCQSRQQVQNVTQFILHWLLEFLSKIKPDPCLMSIHPHLLSRVAFMYSPFFELYLSHLLRWAERMGPNICSSENDFVASKGIQWRLISQGHTLKSQDKAKQHLTFASLINHFKHLVTGPSFIADGTKKELHSRFAERESFIKSVEFRKSSDTLDLNIWDDICAFLPI